LRDNICCGDAPTHPKAQEDAVAEDDIDFVVAAYRDDNQWSVRELPAALGEDFAGFTEALGRFPSEVGVLGFASINDDFFVIVRRSGNHIRALLSDVSATFDWSIAGDLMDLLDLPEPEDDDVEPAGDLEILADLGLSSVELSLLCEDGDLYPDEVLSDIAGRLGFGEPFDAVIG
jgi:putative tRNA adenosine deaminase-associated protein